MLLYLLPLFSTNSLSFFSLSPLFCHLPHMLSSMSLPVFALLFLGYCPFMFLLHLSHACFKPHVLLFSTVLPSVLPLDGEMSWCVSWADHPSSCCLPTATRFPSCVAVFLCFFPSAFACHSHDPSLHLSLYHVCSSLFLSHCIHPMSAPAVSFISPKDRPVRKIQPLVHKQPDVVLSARVHVLHAILSSHLHFYKVFVAYVSHTTMKCDQG